MPKNAFRDFERRTKGLKKHYEILLRNGRSYARGLYATAAIVSKNANSIRRYGKIRTTPVSLLWEPPLYSCEIWDKIFKSLRLIELIGQQDDLIAKNICSVLVLGRFQNLQGFHSRLNQIYTKHTSCSRNGLQHKRKKRSS